MIHKNVYPNHCKPFSEHLVFDTSWAPSVWIGRAHEWKSLCAIKTDSSNLKELTKWTFNML